MNQEQVAGTAMVRGVFTGKGTAATNGVAWHSMAWQVAKAAAQLNIRAWYIDKALKPGKVPQHSLYLTTGAGPSYLAMHAALFRIWAERVSVLRLTMRTSALGS